MSSKDPLYTDRYVDDFPVTADGIDGTAGRLRVATRHAYGEAGTWFPAVRAMTHRRGDVSTPYARVQNLGRARVVVT